MEYNDNDAPLSREEEEMYMRDEQFDEYENSPSAQDLHDYLTGNLLIERPAS